MEYKLKKEELVGYKPTVAIAQTSGKGYNNCIQGKIDLINSSVEYA